jgi:L-amino acid N-acyltransferase YncA
MEVSSFYDKAGDLHKMTIVLPEEYAPPRELPRHLRKQPPPEPEFGYIIREAVPSDLPDIREIYNHYVLNSVVTFDEKAMTLREWKSKFSHLVKHGFPVLVAETPSKQIIGYALVQPWRMKSAFRYTVENSIYLRAASTGKGLGRDLLGALIERCKADGFREMIAVIADSGAEASVKLHEEFGFKEVGRMGRVGFKFGRSIGTITLQKSLKKS